MRNVGGEVAGWSGFSGNFMHRHCEAPCVFPLLGCVVVEVTHWCRGGGRVYRGVCDTLNGVAGFCTGIGHRPAHRTLRAQYGSALVSGKLTGREGERCSHTSPKPYHHPGYCAHVLGVA